MWTNRCVNFFSAELRTCSFTTLSAVSLVVKFLSHLCSYILNDSRQLLLILNNCWIHNMISGLLSISYNQTEQNIIYTAHLYFHWMINYALFDIWAATRQNQQNKCAPSEDSDQPGHPPSLIRGFAVRMKKARVLSYLIRLGGCPGWSESSLGAQSLCWFCHVAAHLEPGTRVGKSRQDPITMLL